MEIPHALTSGITHGFESGSRSVPHVQLGFAVEGVVFHDKRQKRKRAAPGQAILPCLFLQLPTMPIHFSAPDNGEVRIIFFDMPSLRYQAKSKTIFLDDGARKLCLPQFLPVAAAETDEIQSQFERISDMLAESMPTNKTAADFILAGLLARFLPITHNAESPADLLKRMIDEDVTWTYTIAELSEKSGYNRDYLRRDFCQKFEISPLDYRMQRRLQVILRLFAFTNLSYKEISCKVGMRHTTHLNALLKELCDKTPTEVMRDLRGE